MGRISVATSADAHDVTVLRKLAFAYADQFRMTDDSGLEWGEEDQSGIVTAAWNDAGEIVSTTRGEVITDQRHAERKMMSTVPLGDEAFPSLLLTRGATRDGYGKTGLHSALRYYFIDAALNAGFASMLGLVYEGAPRIRLMEQIGYDLVPAARNWEKEAEILARPLVACLPRDRMRAALETLRAMVGPALDSFPWTGPRLVINSPGTLFANPGRI